MISDTTKDDDAEDSLTHHQHQHQDQHSADPEAQCQPGNPGDTIVRYSQPRPGLAKSLSRDNNWSFKTK